VWLKKNEGGKTKVGLEKCEFLLKETVTLSDIGSTRDKLTVRLKAWKAKGHLN